MMSKAVGATGAGIVSVAAMISMFAALNGTVLGGSRIPFAMARDGLFFASAGKIHPRFHTPASAIWFLTATACVLVLSGRYEQLFTSVIFSSWILYAMATASVFVFRARNDQPSGDGTYRALGYPWVPGLFVATAIILLGATLLKSPRESILGLGIIVLGIPFYITGIGNPPSTKRIAGKIPIPPYISSTSCSENGTDPLNFGSRSCTTVKTLQVPDFARAVKCARRRHFFQRTLPCGSSR